VTVGVPRKALNVHGLEGVRGTTRCRRPTCRAPVDAHARETLACPGDPYGRSLSIHVPHKGASQSFLQDEVRWCVLLFKALRNGKDPRTLHNLLRRPEGLRVQRKFQHMESITNARARLATRFED
jgi:hypothetical protein